MPTTTYSFYIQNGVFCQTNEAHTPITAETAPMYRFGDKVTHNLTFPPGTLAKDDVLYMGMDCDKLTGGVHGSMAHAKHVVTEQEASDQAVEIVMDTRWEKFLGEVNGQRRPISCSMGLYVIDASGAYITLAESLAWARSVVIQPGDPDVELNPANYYTKDEVNAIMLRFEKGVADTEQAAHDAQQAKEDAIRAKNAAQTANSAAQQAKTDAVQAKTDAQAANAAAQQAKTDAVNAKNDAVNANNAAQQAKTDAVNAKNDAQAALTEFEHRLSTAYVYGIDWKDADMTQDRAGQCVVLNNIYDNAQYDTSLRYMQVEAHGILPAHNWKRCTMRTARNVNYYLHPSNSKLKEDGTAAILTGADGDVMSDIDITHFRIDTYMDAQDIQHTVWLCSDRPFNGSFPDPFFYVSPDGKTLRKQFVASFRSCICDADGNTLNNNHAVTADATYQADKSYYSRSANVFTKLTPGTDYTVGGTITQGSTVDTKIYEKTVVASPTGYSAGRKYRSVAGALPAASATRAQFRSGHANNGFDSINFLFGSYMGKMMAIEYGTISAQAKFSVGYTNLSDWNYKSMRLTGRTAAFGNNSGEIIADDIDAAGEDYDLLIMKNGASLWNSTAQGNHAQRVVQCSYRGIEDPFGSQWCNDDGIQKNQDAIDLSITYGGNIYLRDMEDDPQSISLYCWMSGTTKFYTTAEEPEIGLNLYANTSLSTVTGTVASVGEGTITVGSATYTRSSANDTAGHSYAWKSGESVIYSHVVNPHTDTNTREVFSDAQLTVKLGNVTAAVDDYSESGYWFTQSTAKYSWLDTDRGRMKGDEYVFPPTGYTGEEAVWVHHEWPKVSGYYCYFDPITFFPIYRAGNWGSATKGLCDYFYNDANAGPRLALRYGHTTYGGTAGPFSVAAINSLTLSSPSIGSRSAA